MYRYTAIIIDILSYVVYDSSVKAVYSSNQNENFKSGLLVQTKQEL